MKLGSYWEGLLEKGGETRLATVQLLTSLTGPKYQLDARREGLSDTPLSYEDARAIFAPDVSDYKMLFLREAFQRYQHQNRDENPRRGEGTDLTDLMEGLDSLMQSHFIQAEALSIAPKDGPPPDYSVQIDPVFPFTTYMAQVGKWGLDEVKRNLKLLKALIDEPLFNTEINELPFNNNQLCELFRILETGIVGLYKGVERYSGLSPELIQAMLGTQYAGFKLSDDSLERILASIGNASQAQLETLSVIQEIRWVAGEVEAILEGDDSLYHLTARDHKLMAEAIRDRLLQPEGARPSTTTEPYAFRKAEIGRAGHGMDFFLDAAEDVLQNHGEPWNDPTDPLDYLSMVEKIASDAGVGLPGRFYELKVKCQQEPPLRNI